MDHHVFNVDAADRGEVVAQLVGGQGRTLAFARTKHQAKRWARTLTASGIHAVDLHGNLSQAARQRNLAAFADGDVRVLVATDIAARGIHVDDITLVVHIDPPAEHKAYLHRSGRTARAGAAGVVVTVATHDQRRDVADLMRRAAITPTQHKVRAGDSAITDISGPSAPRVVVPNAQPRSVVRRFWLGLAFAPGPGVRQFHQPLHAAPVVLPALVAVDLLGRALVGRFDHGLVEQRRRHSHCRTTARAPSGHPPRGRCRLRGLIG
jgi:hypothetical protein